MERKVIKAFVSGFFSNKKIPLCLINIILHHGFRLQKANMLFREISSKNENPNFLH